MIVLVLAPNLILNENLSKSIYFLSLAEKVNITIEFCIFELLYIPNFNFLVKNRKSQHHHLIYHIRISLDSKFHFRRAIVNFSDQDCSKRIFPHYRTGILTTSGKSILFLREFGLKKFPGLGGFHVYLTKYLLQTIWPWYHLLRLTFIRDDSKIARYFKVSSP